LADIDGRNIERRGPRKSRLARLQPHLLALEPRMMFDGAAVATLVDTVSQPDPTASPHVSDDAAAARASLLREGAVAFVPGRHFERTGLDDHGVGNGARWAALHDLYADRTPAETPAPTNIIFIDTGVAGYAELAREWADRGEVILIDASRDGIDQIMTALAGRSDIDAIHIVSHGTANSFALGTTIIDRAAVTGELAGAFASIGSKLTADGDILIYGCDTGAGEQGQELVDAIARASGADVAASTDDTGAAAKGGDWDLEARAGLVQAAVLDSGHWNGLLTRTNSGAWTIGTGTASTTSEGITTTVTFTGAGTSTFSGQANDTFNNIAAFDNSAQGTPSLAFVYNSTNTTDLGTITITFSQAVINPVINLDRLGGVSGTANSALLTLLTSGATLTKLAGPAHLVVGTNSITRQVGVATAGTESSLNSATGTAAGSVRVNGTFTTLTFSVRMNPGAAAGSGDGFEIGVAIDAPPDAQNDNLSTNEDVATLNGNLFANNGNGADSDPRGDAFTVSAAQNSAGGAITIGTASTLPSGATVTVRADGTFSYSSNGIYNSLKLGETRTETFTYTVRDANGGTDTATATITIVGVNDAPVAVNDSTTTAEDTPVTVTVLANDTDVDGDPLSVTAASAANGTVVRNANGTITYTPNANYNGTDTITYTISDGKGGTSTATVAVTITPVEDAPLNGVPGGQTVAEDGTLTFSTANGNAISISNPDGAGVHTVTMNVTNGSFSLSGVTGLTFTEGDGTSDSVMTFTGTVAAINAALQGARYVPTADYNGPAQISMRTIANPTPSGAFTNGGFELPNFTGTPAVHIVGEATVPGWDTDATDNQIEIWDSGFQSVTAYEGNQFAEINANQVAALFQNFTPTAGSNVSISFAHRGRQGVDVMRVVATDLGANGVVGGGDDTVLLNELFSDGNTAWSAYTRQLTDNATGNIIRFEFRSISAAGGNPSVGNFVDGIAPIEGKADFDTINVTVTPVADIVNDTVTTPEDTAITYNPLGNDSFENPARTITAVNGNAISVGQTVTVDNGTLRMNSGGTFTFTPNANFNGSTSFTYTVTSNGTTETATDTITVTPVNDAPTATGSLPPRSNVDAAPVSIPTAGGFTDIDGDALTYSATGLPAGLTINAVTGVISGTIDRSASQTGGGSYAIVVTARDAAGLAATQSFTWTVTNPGPTAGNDIATTNEDTSVTIPVLTNDNDPDGDPLTITAASAANGTVVRNADGTITYTPNANFNGTDTITYTISDGQGGTSTATVTVTVAAVNDAPVPVGTLPNRSNVDAATGVSVATAGGFSDVDNATLTYSVTGLPAGLTINATTGAITGTIDRSASQVGGGVYSVVVTARDAAGLTATQTFTWTVTNPAPTAANDTVSTPEDTPVTINVLTNDVDPDGDPLAVVAAVASIGQATINPNNTITYTPPANFNGTVTINYTISDGQGGTANAQVTITVTAVQDAPVVVTPLGNRSNVDAQSGISVATAGSFTDVDGDTLTYTATGLPAGLTINATTGVISGTIDRSASQVNGGAYTVQVTASDGGRSVSTSFTWTVTNPAPVAGNDSATTNEDTPVTIPVLTNDSDPDGDPLTVTTASALNGTVTINANGSLTYSPNANFNGTDTITYMISDGQGGTTSATVTVTVNSVNDVPVAGALGNHADSDNEGVSFSVAGAFSDADGDTLTYGASGLPAGISINPVTGVISGTIDNSASQVNGGVYSVTITASDGRGGVVSSSFTWTVTNPAPTAANDTISTNEDVSVRIPVLANDSDPDGDTLTVVSASASIGSVTINPDGSLQYVPPANFNGPVTINYTISDGEGGQSTATVTVNVVPINDAPVTTGLMGQSGVDGGTVSVPTGQAFSDVDGDVLTFAATGLPPGLTIDPATGLISGTLSPDASDATPYTVRIFATDPSGATVSTTFQWDVANVGPNAANDNATTPEDTPVNINVLANDVDPDGDALTVTAATSTNGTVVINPDNTLTFTPNANFNGTATINYTVRDADGTPASATVTVTVTPVNDTPVAGAPLPARANLDGDAISVPAAGSFSDIDGDALTYTATGLPPGLTINAATGVISGTIDRSASQAGGGVYNVVVTATDPGGAAATQSFSWAVTNPGPIADSDNATTAEDTSVTVNVLANDVDPDGDPLTVTAASAGNGTVVINPDGTISYTPNANFNGTDTINYTISDGQGGTTTATVTVTVTPVNDPPVAVNDTASTNEDTPVRIGILGNDSDLDGDALTVTAATAVNGIVVINADGTITYTPNANFNGTDTISYTISDGKGGFATATVTVTVAPVNDAPVAVNDTANTPEDTPVIIGVLTNDSDVDGDPLTITAASATNGTVVRNANGTITYTPNANFNGTDTITYTISDGKGGFSTATVTVTVDPVNDGPIATPPLNGQVSVDGAPASVTTANNFVDPDGDALTYTATGLPPGLTINAVTGVISGTIDRSASQTGGGTYNVVVTATDTSGASAISPFTWTVTNPAPTANNDTATTPEDTSITIPVLVNDTDPDGDPLRVTSATAASGTVIVNANGTITYTPNANFNGTDTITYTISDDQGGTSTATVTVTVTPVQDAPAVVTPIANRTGVDAQSGISVPTAGSFTDVDGDTLTYSAAGLPAGLTIDPVTGVISGTIDRGASQVGGGSYSVQVTATDPGGRSVTTGFTWTVANPAPTAANDNATTPEDTPVTISVLANDNDPDGDPLTVTAATATNGTVVRNADGTITYTPNANFNGTDTITYTISDGNGGTSTATVTVTVAAVNDAPVPVGTLPSRTNPDAGVVSMPVAGAFSDVDNATLSYSAAGLPPGLSIDPVTGVISGTVSNSASQQDGGIYSVTITATDAAGLSATQTFSWTITNPAPLAANDTATTNEDTLVIIPVLANDSDPDGDVLRVTSASAANGAVVINGDGTISYTPNGNFNGTDTITYTITDDQGGTSTATVTVTVNAVNDGPIATPPLNGQLSSDASSASVATALNFRDPDGDALTYTATGLPPGLSINPATGVISGTIAANASQTNGGVYNVIVTATDPSGASANSPFTWTVTNPAPTAVNDAVTINEDQSVPIAVLANDNDPDGDTLSVASASAAHGTVIINANGTITYTPNANFNGTDTISYTISDGQGGTSTATVTVTVIPVNDAPTTDGVANLFDLDSSVVSIPLAAEFQDVDGDALTYGAAGLPPGLSINPATGVISGTIAPNASTGGPGANGIYTVTITASDGNGGSVPVTFTWTIRNVGPVANDDSQTTAEDTPVTINVLANDVDDDGDPLTVTNATASNGTVLVNNDGTITYTPPPNFTGRATITYTIADTDGAFSTAVVVIDVTPGNDAPTSSPLTDRSSNDGTAITPVPVAAFFSDIDGDALSYTATGLPPGLSIDLATGVISGTINRNASQTNGGSYSVTITATDPGGLTTSQTFTWTVANPAPTAVNDSATVVEDTTVSIPVLTNDNDPDGDPLTVIHASATRGTVVINGDGTLSYTPDPDFNGPDIITYTISDGNGGTSTATVAITVTPGNDAPTTVGLPNRFDTNSDPVNVTIVGGFNDLDGDTLNYTATGLPAGLTLDPVTGVISGTTAPNGSAGGPNGDGIYPVTVTVSDGNGGTVTTTFTWTISNVPPRAANDSYSTPEDVPVIMDVLTNDVDASPLQIVAANATNGTAVINADGTISFTPDRDFHGTATVTYTVSDGLGGFSSAVATIIVVPTNDAPTASPLPPRNSSDAAVVDVPTAGSFADLDGDTLTYGATGLPAGLTIDPATGRITGTIAADASQQNGGLYTVTVTARDPSNASVSSTFTWTVGNPPPVAANDTASTAEDTLVTIPVLTNDTDPDGDTVTVTGATAANGSVTINPDGTLAYIPNANFNGTDTITYTISDGQGGTSTATVTVTVTPVNDPPVAANDNASTAEDTPVTINILGNDVDPDGDPLTVVTATAPNGTVTINPDGTIVYTPNANFNGADTITYTIKDSSGATSTATVSVVVAPVNDPPVAVNDIASTTEDTPVTVSVLGNDTDIEGDPLTVTAASAVSGTVTINPDGTLAYVPNANFNGTDTITYTISDGKGGTSTATVTVTVAPANDPPVASNDTATTDEDTLVTIPVLTNDTDIDGDPLTVTAASSPNGTVTINADGTISYTPNANFNGTDTITYTISDGKGGTSTATVTVTVNPVNDAPVAVPDSITTAEDTPVTIPVLGNDSDPEGDPLTVTAATSPNGTVTINPDGTIRYTPNANFSGTDTITYTISDGKGGTSTATVTVTVNPVNDPPVAVNDNASTNEDTPVTIPVLANDTDVEGNPLTVTNANAVSGTVTINPDGTIRYTPNANFNGTDTITYTISDGNGGFSTATVTVTVNPVNDAPVAIDDAATTREDTPVTIPVLANDFDVDGDPLTVTAASAPNGTVTINADGTITYTPNRDFNGNDLITYTITDGKGGFSTVTIGVTVTVVASNDPPVAVNDTAATNEDTPVTIPVLANDSDPEGNPLTVTAATAANGVVVVNANGTVSYTPNANFNGTDTITYTVSDGQGGFSTATVTVTVIPVNDRPVAANDTASTNEDTPVTIPVLANDSDIDGDPLTVTTATAPNGTVTINADGTISYTPNANFNGTDTITYTISDGNGGTATATVTVTVDPVNDPPVAVNDTASTNEDTPVTIPVLANDTDVEGNSLTVISASSSNGTVTINPDGTISYTPNANFNGTDTITYTISDGNGGTSTATVTVTVNPVNDPPAAVNDIASTNEDTPVTIPVLANDTDIDGNPLIVTTATSPNGTVTINADGTISYTPNANFNGTDTITYTISDGKGGTSTATVTVTVNPVNDPPVAANDTASTNEDTPVTIPVLANDTDVDGNPLTVTTASSPNGTVTINPDGTISYTPNANFNGTDTITYTIRDGNGGTSTATVTVTVNPVNDPPVAANDTASTNEDSPVTIPVLANDTDVDGNPLTVTSASSPNGTVTINPDGTISYTPNANFNGTDTITYTISDGNGGTSTATVTVTVNPVNDPPVAANDTASTNEDTPVTIPVLTNDTDVEGNPLTVTSASSPNGTVTINADGTISYSPNANFNGTDTITYTISDGNGGTSTATVTVTVNPVNDPPVAANDTASTNEDSPVTIPVLANDTDVDGDPLTVTAASSPNGTVTINADGTISYTPNANFNGTDTITYTVSDGKGGTSTATVTVTVNPVNDAPVAVGDNATTSEDRPVTIPVLANDTDVEGDPLTVTTATASNGTVTINPDGTISYTPNANFNGTDTITYTVSDGKGGTSTATVTVTVNPVNDAPVDGTETVTTIVDRPVTVPVLGNASDVDGDPLSVISATPSIGMAVINADGTITYTPPLGFRGVATISYVVSDGKGGTVVSSFTVSVGDAGADINALLGTNGLDRGEPSSIDRGTGLGEQPFAAPLIILDAVNDINPLQGTADLNVGRPVLAAVNGIDWLKGTPSFESGGHPISDVVAHLDRLRELRTPGEDMWTGRSGSFDIETLTGFSARQLSGADGQIMIESVARGNALYVEMRDIGDDSTSPIVEYQLRMRDGRPLPDWIRMDSRGLAIIERPLDADEIRLIVRGLRADGTVIEIPVIVQGETGEIQLDEKLAAGKRISDAAPLGRMIAAQQSAAGDEAARLLGAFEG
jgi:CshA-type fibril repeat protein